MSIEISNKLKAMGSVAGTTGEMVAGAGAESAQTGIGTYTLNIGQYDPVSATFKDGLDAAECACMATLRGSSAGSITIEQTSDSVKTVRTFNSAGNAANADFDFTIWAAPAGIAP